MKDINQQLWYEYASVIYFLIIPRYMCIKKMIDLV